MRLITVYSHIWSTGSVSYEKGSSIMELVLYVVGQNIVMQSPSVEVGALPKGELTSLLTLTES